MTESIKTEVIFVDPQHVDSAKDALRRAGEIIREGGLVAFPTETVYGLGGDALNPNASNKIYAAKGRPSDNPLIVHIADMAHLDKIVKKIPEKARQLAKAYWPGPLTMIFEKADIVPMQTSGGLTTVAVRMPSDPIALELIRQSGGYIAAPSANTSGRPSPTLAQHVIDDLSGKIDMIIDGGQVNIGLESTIVDFTEEIPVILRPGYINQEMLQEVIGEVRVDPAILDHNANKGLRPKAPGMRYRHYAPKCSLTIVEGDGKHVISMINQLTKEAKAQGRKVGVIATDETKDAYCADEIRDVGSIEDDETIAKNLFEVLREFDDAGVEIAYSESFHTPRMGMAIMNRLLKAAGHQVICADEEE